jgi:hypothetical protein
MPGQLAYLLNGTCGGRQDIVVTKRKIPVGNRRRWEDNGSFNWVLENSDVNLI